MPVAEYSAWTINEELIGKEAPEIDTALIEWLEANFRVGVVDQQVSDFIATLRWTHDGQLEGGR